jgi:phosphomannomutase/phosphoglucomutase
MAVIAAEIFKAYDIRGIVGKQLNADALVLIGRAIGTEALVRKQATLVLGCDGRHSSEALSEALIAGIRATGVNVIDIGVVPTPLVWFAAHHLETLSGVMITGSHNPPEYNGVKIMLGGETLAGDAIQALRQRIDAGEFADGQGSYRQADVREDYLSRIEKDIVLSRRLNIIVDAGNGVGGPLAAACES